MFKKILSIFLILSLILLSNVFLSANEKLIDDELNFVKHVENELKKPEVLERISLYYFKDPDYIQEVNFIQDSIDEIYALIDNIDENYVKIIKETDELRIAFALSSYLPKERYEFMVNLGEKYLNNISISKDTKVVKTLETQIKLAKKCVSSINLEDDEYYFLSESIYKNIEDVILNIPVMEGVEHSYWQWINKYSQYYLNGKGLDKVYITKESEQYVDQINYLHDQITCRESEEDGYILYQKINELLYNIKGVGDIDKDNVCATDNDIALLLNYITKSKKDSEGYMDIFDSGDIDKDGVITIKDAVLLLQLNEMD